MYTTGAALGLVYVFSEMVAWVCVCELEGVWVFAWDAGIGGTRVVCHIVWEGAAL